MTGRPGVGGARPLPRDEDGISWAAMKSMKRSLLGLVLLAAAPITWSQPVPGDWIIVDSVS